MRKILLIMLLMSTHSFAENLKCLNSYETLRNIQDEGINILENGTIKQVLDFNEQYDYANLYKNKHPGKGYWMDDWVDDDIAKTSLIVLATSVKSGKFKIINYTLNKPKANFISSVGEVCVIPVQSTGIYYDEEGTTNADIIFVRDLKSNLWRIYSYYGSERKEYFNEFFPDFPKSIKLSASSTIYKSGHKLTSIDVAQKIFKDMGGEMPPEVLINLQKSEKEAEARKKLNSF